MSVGVSTAGAAGSYRPALNPALTPVAKFESSDVSAAFTTAAAAKRITPIAAPVTQAQTTRVMTRRPASSVSAPAASNQQEAQRILDRLIATYPILRGTTVTFGDAKGHQAIAYYTSGRIVISATHTASLQRIIEHEIWHIIDWRDNGKINWGESVPPSNWRDYVGK